MARQPTRRRAADYVSYDVKGRIVTATLVAGTLDIVAAAVLTKIAHQPLVGMLAFIASGPLPFVHRLGSLGAAAAGLAVHFAIMAAMAAAFVYAADRYDKLKQYAFPAGAAYGLLTWAVMNLLVLHARWPHHFPQLGMRELATSLFCHIVLVGIPIALIARRA